MRFTVTLPLLAFALSLGGRALAQDNHAAAVQLYDAAEALTKAGRLAEACPKYAESYRLDPQLGALLHSADCLERNGQLASAYAAFRDAAEVAGQKGDDRKALAEGRAQALEPRLTRVAIELAPDAKVPGLEVLKDGTLLSDASFGMPIAVDRGEHRVEARAPGYKPWFASILAQTEGATERVVVPLLEPAPAAPPVVVPPPQPTPAPPPPPAKSGGPSAATWVAGGVAVVGLTVGVVFNVLARSANSDAESLCTNDESDKNCIVEDEDDAAKREDNLDKARTNRTVSYISFGVGGAAAVVAVVTLLIPSSKSPAQQAFVVTPAVSRDGGGLFMRGSF